MRYCGTDEMCPNNPLMQHERVNLCARRFESGC
jgi:hypothetical protein